MCTHVVEKHALQVQLRAAVGEGLFQAEESVSLSLVETTPPRLCRAVTV